MLIEKNTISEKDFLNEEIVRRSVDQEQYDEPNINWDYRKKHLFSPARRLMFRGMLYYVKDSTGKNVLEIGCGTGWLINEIKKYSPGIVEGIDSSLVNVKAAKSMFPGIKVSHTSFSGFKTENLYDKIYSIMTLSHFWDLSDFFRRCTIATKQKAQLILIVPDYDYFKRPRKNEEMKVVHFNDCYAVSIKKDQKILSQIVRKSEVYHEFAQKSHFCLIEEKVIETDAEFVSNYSKETELGIKMFNLLVYQKQEK